jgi:drug/metabolite transporter (DMT)-like permease
MNKDMLVALAIGIVVTAFGDFFLKRGSLHENIYANADTIMAAIAYMSTTFVWCYMLRKSSLVEFGVWYSLASIVVTVSMGYFMFKEQVTAKQMSGIAFTMLGVWLVSSK